MRQDEMRGHILVLLMKGILYHSLACVLFNLVLEKSIAMDLKLLILFVPLMLFAVIRRKCENFFLFILFHAVVGGVLALLFSSLEGRITAGVCIIFMALGSMKERLTGDTEECPLVPSLIWFILVYLVEGQMQRLQVLHICYYEAFLFLILFAAHRNMTKLTDFLKLNERMENLPAEQMKGMNHMMLVIFILFFAAGMLFMPNLPVDSLFGQAANLLWMLLRGFFLLLQWLLSRDESQENFMEECTKEIMPPAEAGEASALAQILEKIFITAGYVLLAAGAVYLTVRIFYEIYRRFYDRHREAADESEFIWKEPVLKEWMKRQRQQKESVTGSSMNQKIRRLYKKSIRRRFGAKTAIPTALTPMELEHAALEVNENTGDVWDDKKVRSRVAIYEKARYSQHECEKQDIEIMKQNLSR